MKSAFPSSSGDVQSSDAPAWARRAFIVAGILFAASFGIVALWRLNDLLPVAFATVLLSVAWRGAAEGLAKRFGLSPGVWLLLVALGLCGFGALSIMLFGRQLMQQYDEMALDIPAAIALIRKAVEEHPWGRFVEAAIGWDSVKSITPVARQLGAILGSLGSALAFAVSGIIGAAYLVSDPQGHIAGVLSLTPPSYRGRMSAFLERSGSSLRQWLVIQLYVVAMNAAFAGAALWAFNVPAPLALASISGLLAFIPYFGSIVAIVVAGLVALPHGIGTAALAALAVGGASFIEGYLITPILQSRSLMVRPVVLLFFLLVFGKIYGAIGVALAVPATVVLYVAWDVFLNK
ncbi:AI-2E family transporter [Methylocystis parvus]|uniref:AI-2E family transporter n=1 Tax=Methylocystis parvus TaxID=134 RepID=A0A6B8MAZ8_9HYPH|nr:AI-2E family transporter [Methylocystis parvus]QGM98922.1 AI-2E family transporter [Methylocystis parvus]WBK00723.1 AI-2E family transporter [Methylocystis parvus OBBP]